MKSSNKFSFAYFKFYSYKIPQKYPNDGVGNNNSHTETHHVHSRGFGILGEMHSFVRAIGE